MKRYDNAGQGGETDEGTVTKDVTHWESHSRRLVIKRERHTQIKESQRWDEAIQLTDTHSMLQANQSPSNEYCDVREKHAEREEETRQRYQTKFSAHSFDEDTDEQTEKQSSRQTDRQG